MAWRTFSQASDGRGFEAEEVELYHCAAIMRRFVTDVGEDFSGLSTRKFEF
jgi:hypothetical protein